MNGTVILTFVAIVFAAVFLLMQGLTVSATGDARMRRTLKRRLSQISSDSQQNIASLLREKYLTSLSPTERWFEELPLMDDLAKLTEQAGKKTPAYQVVLVSVVLGLVVGAAALVFLHNWILALIGTGIGLSVPYFRLVSQRRNRFDKIEEQLPDAMDMIRRALRGHPFNSAIKLVAEDMPQPIAGEFEMTFSDLNFGNDVRRAMLGLLNRVPSVTVMALVTTVLVQRETGGNLAEILGQISGVVRGRFRFGRKVRTLSAEGRMSAWVLAMMPVALIVMMSISSPNYLPVMLERPLGHQMLYGAGGLAVVGILWIRRLLRIEV